jgi:hypothetical protein
VLDIGGARHNLVPHPDLAWLMARGHLWNELEPWYIGPGITWDATVKRVYGDAY